MDKKTHDIWNDDDSAEERPRKKRSRLRRFLLFLLALVAVLAVVLVAAWRDGTGFDALRRYFSYGTSEQEEEYTYDAASSNRFVILGDRLVVLSDTSLRLLGRGGEEIWSTQVKMNTPALASGGSRAVAYDVGGTELYVLDENGLLLELTADTEYPFLAATLNDEGWLAVTSQKQGYKGSVTVYSADLEEQPVMVFDSSDRFVTDAYVTDDCKRLAAVTLGQENGVFVSNIVLYSLEKAGEVEPIGDYDVSDGLVLAIGQQGDRLVTVADTCLSLADRNGEDQVRYDYSGGYLREYALEGDGFTALLLNRYRSGSVGRLVTVDDQGEEIASLEVRDEVLGVSAAGRYLGVLYLDRLVIYNQELQEYAVLNGISYAKTVLMCQDGTALLVGSQKAELFLP